MSEAEQFLAVKPGCTLDIRPDPQEASLPRPLGLVARPELARPTVFSVRQASAAV